MQLNNIQTEPTKLSNCTHLFAAFLFLSFDDKVENSSNSVTWPLLWRLPFVAEEFPTRDPLLLDLLFVLLPRV